MNESIYITGLQMWQVNLFEAHDGRRTYLIEFNHYELTLGWKLNFVYNPRVFFMSTWWEENMAIDDNHYVMLSISSSVVSFFLHSHIYNYIYILLL